MKPISFLRPIIIMTILTISSHAYGQAPYRSSAKASNDTVILPPATIPQASAPLPAVDHIVTEDFRTTDSAAIDSAVNANPRFFFEPLPKFLFSDPVFTTYHFFDFEPFKTEIPENEAFMWVEREKAIELNREMILQRFMIARPDLVKYNLALLPEAPKKYVMEINPKDHTIEIREVEPGKPIALPNENLKKRHWIRNFNASIQFSQAYISPNWYQGGKNNLNILLNVAYDVKLNPAFHPNLMFETNFRYKLGLNSAPDDSLRNYSISEDLLQINSTLGVKAARRWYYSVAAMFKTQVLNSYATNTRNLKSAFLSPGELNVGLGMTYNYENKKKTFNFYSSISPLTYNLRICTDMSMNHADYDIRQDRRTRHKFGSSGEFKLTWRLASNILFTSRLFTFTDFDALQADWENTLSMDINRFLSTQIYCHARYDTATPRIEDEPHWHKLQVKEILSFGFAYKFNSF